MQVQHHQIECLRCQTKMEFVGKQTWLNVNLAGDSFSLFRCPRCGKIEFFEPDFEPEQDIACLSCGAAIGPDQNKCPACGWSWEVPNE